MIATVEENFGASWPLAQIAVIYPLNPQFAFACMHSENTSLPLYARDFLISTATATTTVFIPTVKQGTVAFRSSVCVCARLLRAGLPAEEIQRWNSA